MEFVIVRYPNDRGVNVDGGPLGKTEQKLRMAAGTHDFDLGAPTDYMPESLTIKVARTSASNPMIVTFTPIVPTPDDADETRSLPPVTTGATSARKGARRSAKKTGKAAKKTSDRKDARRATTKTGKPAKKTSARKDARRATTKTGKPAKKTVKKHAKKSVRKSGKKQHDA